MRLGQYYSTRIHLQNIIRMCNIVRLSYLINIDISHGRNETGTMILNRVSPTCAHGLTSSQTHKHTDTRGGRIIANEHKYNSHKTLCKYYYLRLNQAQFIFEKLVSLSIM